MSIARNKDKIAWVRTEATDRQIASLLARQEQVVYDKNERRDLLDEIKDLRSQISVIRETLASNLYQCPHWDDRRDRRCPNMVTVTPDDRSTDVERITTFNNANIGLEARCTDRHSLYGGCYMTFLMGRNAERRSLLIRLSELTGQPLPDHPDEADPEPYPGTDIPSGPVVYTAYAPPQPLRTWTSISNLRSFVEDTPADEPDEHF